MPSERGADAGTARCTGIGAREVFGVVGWAGAAGGESACGGAEFAGGFGAVGAVGVAAAVSGVVIARCTLSVPFPETGAALPCALRRLSGSAVPGPTWADLPGLAGTTSSGTPAAVPPVP
ncbi:hypothetical protein ACGFY7_04770 [Streptomyces prunicolor]|uniref:hypothetical protein n=1 Tax=Streptomyces prunicolor TaxID=67348 RepID=UPI00371E9F54